MQLHAAQMALDDGRGILFHSTDLAAYTMAPGLPFQPPVQTQLPHSSW